MGWIIAGILVVLLIIYFVTIYNKFISYRNKYDEADATIKVYSKKRYDLVPNLVETVKGYTKHEEQALTKVIEARAKAIGASSFEDMEKSEAQLGSALKNLFALAESYPDLKANESFLQLQKQLSSLEDDLAGARRYYNAVIKVYNTLTERIPSSLVAKIAGFKKQPYYEVDDEQLDNVQVSF